jgi:hypothetical protein
VSEEESLFNSSEGRRNHSEGRRNHSSRTVQQLKGEEESLQVKRFCEVDVRVEFLLRKFKG